MALEIDDRVGLSDERLAELAAIVARQPTLQEVVRWGLVRDVLVEGIVVQDEYTHDVIVAWRDGLYLVYDTT